MHGALRHPGPGTALVQRQISPDRPGIAAISSTTIPPWLLYYYTVVASFCAPATYCRPRERLRRIVVDHSPHQGDFQFRCVHRSVRPHFVLGSRASLRRLPGVESRAPPRLTPHATSLHTSPSRRRAKTELSDLNKGQTKTADIPVRDPPHGLRCTGRGGLRSIYRGMERAAEKGAIGRQETTCASAAHEERQSRRRGGTSILFPLLARRLPARPRASAPHR